MGSLHKVNYRHQSLPLSVHHHCPSFSGSISSLSFITSPPPAPPPLSSPSHKSLSASFKSASSSSSSSFSYPPLPIPKITKPQFFQTLSPFPFSLLKTTFIATVTATALFFARCCVKPLIAAPVSPPPTVDTAADDAVSAEDQERTLEEYVVSHPDDVQALRNLMEAKIKNRKVDEAISVIEQLIRLEPNENEWPLLKAHMNCYNGALELAKTEFNEILSKDLLCVEAYHGLVMVSSQSDSSSELKEIERKIERGMEICEKEKKKEDLRDFKLLLAQIRVIEGNYNGALMIYDELVKEEPRDFRPYLCEGIIHTLLGKKDKAEEQFQMYRSLVPKGHPYARYFDDNVMATKVFALKMENEGALPKS